MRPYLRYIKYAANKYAAKRRGVVLISYPYRKVYLRLSARAICQT